MLRGYATFLNVSKWIFMPLAYIWVALLRMPTYSNPRLLDRPDHAVGKDTNSTKWPLVIFSHGLAGTSTVYSQFCSNLASEGYVVLAIGHGDRTAPMVITRENGQNVEKPYLRLDKVQWEGGVKPNNSIYPLRVEQLEFRRTEVYEVLKAFTDAVNGNHEAVEVQNAPEFSWNDWKGRVECERDVILAGHSFGSATMMSLLAHPPPEGFPPLSVNQVILLDPWVEPFLPLGPLPLPIGDTPRPAACIIASEGFAIWDQNFLPLYEIVKAWRSDGTPAHLMTIRMYQHSAGCSRSGRSWNVDLLVRSAHQEFSDFGTAVRRSSRAAQVIRGTHETVMKFIRGTLHNELEGKGRVMEIEKVKNKKTIVGNPGELLVHE
ncbi:hypothetical protein FRB99_005413 [Tulasnella sp. 403]|nr:hypothetical protein FRB99_005413 [Tulasnella sp. 403]